jgi:hypothetical protein
MSPGADLSIPVRTDGTALEVEILHGRLKTVGAAVYATRRALAGCMRAISTQEVPHVAADVELDVALLLLQV